VTKNDAVDLAFLRDALVENFTDKFREIQTLKKVMDGRMMEVTALLQML
jgi:hypothetical protein